ncbi:TssN family type VI secretion system protein [Sphingobacterium sp. Mn56C]|uniref:TssN family type VI secretion system protein n=1 Tax=Sphingobacterium sp. Mn56C TaxID=3395261 RepID=UPI003BE451C4
MDNQVIKVIFLKYILVPLVIILLAVILGYMKIKLPSIKWKVIVAYLLVAGICLALPGFLGYSGNTFNPFWYLICMLYYMFCGMLNVNLLQNFFYSKSQPLGFIMLFNGILTTIALLLGGYIFYWIFNGLSPFEGYAFMAATSLTIFLIPLSFYYCFILYITIPFTIYKTWQHTQVHNVFDFHKLESSTLIVITLELTKTTAEGQKSRIDAKAPYDVLAVGHWFYRVVDDYNHKYPASPIQLLDANDEAYSWVFYTKKSIFHFRKFIDFDKTMQENKITKHSTIFCKRVINNEI